MNFLETYNQLSILLETKQDIKNFKNKFGEKTYDDFLRAKDRLKAKKISTDLIYHVKNTEPKEMNDIIQSLYTKDSDKQRLRQIQGTDKEIRGEYDYIGEYGGYKVYQPLDYISSMDLGVNTGWCTTGRYQHAGHPEFTPSENDAKKHWNDYTSKGVEFYYLLDPNTMYGEYALALYPKVLKVNKMDATNNYYITSTNFELFDAEDNNVWDNNMINLCKEFAPEVSAEVSKLIEKNGCCITDRGELIKYTGKDTEVEIPNSVTSIGHHAFYSCSSLTSVTIPNLVTSIGWGTFSNCKNLVSITIPSSVTSIGEHAFDGCTRLTTIKVKPGSYAEQWCKERMTIQMR